MTSAGVVEQNDCIIVSHSRKYHPTADDIARRRKVLDETIVPLSLVKENVLRKDSTLIVHLTTTPWMHSYVL